MSWYDRGLVVAMPFVEEASELREIAQAGNKLFAGLAAKLKSVADDPAAVTALAVMIDDNRDRLTGAILARTPAAAMLDPACMPPGSVQPGAPAVPTGTTGPAGHTSVAAPAGDDYVYDDSDDDDDYEETDDHADDTKPAPKKKKKK